MTGLPSCVHDADHRGTLRGEIVATSRACGRGKTLCKIIPLIKFNVTTYDDVFAYMHALHIPAFLHAGGF